jgi:hypothetical protein
MTNLLELIKKGDDEIDDYLTNVDLEQFKEDVQSSFGEQDQQTIIDKKIDQITSQEI